MNMSIPNQCGAREALPNIQEQEQAIGKAIAELENVTEALEGRVSSARIQLDVPEPANTPNIKSPEPLMSLLAFALKGRAEAILSVALRLRNIVQTIEL